MERVIKVGRGPHLYSFYLREDDLTVDVFKHNSKVDEFIIERKSSLSDSFEYSVKVYMIEEMGVPQNLHERGIRGQIIGFQLDSE